MAWSKESLTSIDLSGLCNMALGKCTSFNVSRIMFL